MIFNFDYVGEPKEYLLVYEILPSPRVGLMLLVLSIILILFYWSQRKNKDFNYFLDYLTLIISSVSLLGTYIYSSRYTDEPFVNLEHTYNLFHHGLFSFSPTRMVDGTVEFLYYLFLTPFAFDRSFLLQTNFIFGAIICWLHLLILWKLLSDINLELKLLLLILFAVSVPFIEIFSSGFGNSLVSLVFFLSLYFQVKGKESKALLLAAILPLIRPDAILYSFSIFFVDFIHKRKVRFTYLILTLAALFSYLGLVRFFYGHWIPTPIEFKSDALSMLSAKELTKSVYFKLENYFYNPFHFLPLFFLLPFLIFPQIFAQLESGIKRLYYYFIPLSVIFLFYLITTHIPEQRYFVGFELLLIVLPLLTIKGLVSNKKLSLSMGEDNNLATSNLLEVRSSRALFLLVCFLTGLVVLMGSTHQYYGLAFGVNNKALKSAQVSRITALGAGGQIVDEVLPKGWKIATTEMNTFGYMNDREIIDLWGYTNPQIALAKICSERGIRNNPDLFLKMQPEVAWLRTDRASGTESSGFPHQAEDLENVLATWGNLGKYRNQYGNVVEVMEGYDLVFLRTENWASTLLVKKELNEQLLAALEQGAYKLAKSRELDLGKLKQIYDEQKLVQFEC